MDVLKFWNYLQSYQSTDDAQVNGYLDPINSCINGTVTAVYVNNDQRVKKGQLLVQLDSRDYQVAVEQARAQRAQAEADLNSARRQYVSAVATIHQAQAQTLAYIDTFWIMAIATLCLIPLVFLLRRVEPGKAPAAH